MNDKLTEIEQLRLQLAQSKLQSAQAELNSTIAQLFLAHEMKTTDEIRADGTICRKPTPALEELGLPELKKNQLDQSGE